MLKYSVLFIAFLIVAIQADNASDAKQSEVETYASKCVLTDACFQGRRYFFENKTKRKRDEALNFCADIGMSLVSVDNCEENEFIANFIKEMDCTHEHFWTSGYQNGDKHWYWSTTGNDVRYENWKTGEPNYKKDEHCIHYRKEFLQWNDEKCSEKYLYICESNESC